MAAIIAHYLSAEEYNNKYRNYTENDLISFLVGAIAADSPRSQGKGFDRREITHFGSSPSKDLIEKSNFDLSGDILDFTSFIQKYEDKLDNPFIEGYLLHLYTDKKWFSEIITDLLNQYVAQIKPNAEKAEDLTFLEAISWYSKKLYATYDIHDVQFYQRVNIKHIEKLSTYNVDTCPIEEIDKDDLKNMLFNLSEKCKNLDRKEIDSISNPLISIETMNSFINSCVIDTYKSISSDCISNCLQCH